MVSGKLTRGLLQKQDGGCSVFCGLDRVHTQGCVNAVLGKTVLSFILMPGGQSVALFEVDFL